ncbi:hypothetical protein [Streptomonospora litoralis]|uniref:Uncharacterized protein n=1 Tax=Streptomonospora litoralis TaxID=2498135 RepID=A0A4P6Q4Y3_9ACTN|nr:hypothetical protein [Streptomonospora litoralis]QBI55776.1 hypothetical protein EKD16_20065 [Streptomonospora litoralis]
MTTPATMPPTTMPPKARTPVALPAPDARAQAHRLKARFPGATCWHGTHTRTWWATLPGLPHLIEAPTPAALADALAQALAAAHAPPIPADLLAPTHRVPPAPATSQPAFRTRSAPRPRRRPARRPWSQRPVRPQSAMGTTAPVG